MASEEQSFKNFTEKEKWYHIKWLYEAGLNCFFKNGECVFNTIDQDVVQFVKSQVECNEDGQNLIFKGPNAIDFLSKIYDDNKMNTRTDKYLQYVKLVNHVDEPVEVPRCQFYRAHPQAVMPTKSRASDVGWDLTIVEKVKDFGDRTTMYDTGISVAPPFGFYTKVFPRSSLSKSGYMMSNSVGLIDSSYRGTLKIVLTRVDDSVPELTLPYRCAQLVLERSQHFLMNEVSNPESLGTTERSSKGFGSSGN